MLTRTLPVLLGIVLFASGCLPIKYTTIDQRVVEMPAGNPDSTPTTAQTLCTEMAPTLGAEVYQHFPTLTQAQRQSVFLRWNVGTFSKTGHTVFITTGVKYEGSLPEAKAMADLCEATVRRAVEARFPTSTGRAEDIPDAQAAFATLLEYQKTDDLRSLDLYTQDCRVVMTYTDGKFMKIRVIPPDVFRKTITEELALKRGNQDTYEDVKYAPEGAKVRVTSTVLFNESGKREPLSLLYVRENGQFKISEMKVTVPVATLPAK